MCSPWKESLRKGVEQLTAESKERGWLFSVVSGWCMAFGLLCILLAAIVTIKSIFGESATLESIVRMFVIGGVIVTSTVFMWKFNKWGRNIAVASVACLSWVVAEAIGRKIGAGISTQMFTATFIGMAMACFTGPRVRGLFALADEQKSEGEEEAS